jgi:hypothetical protein
MRLCAGHEGIAALPQVVGVSNGDLSTCDEHGGLVATMLACSLLTLLQSGELTAAGVKVWLTPFMIINALLFLFRQLTENGAPSW